MQEKNTDTTVDRGDELARALSFHQSGDTSNALAIYSKLLSKDKVSKVVFLNTPPILRSQDKHQEAIDICRRGIASYPYEAGIYNNLGNCYLDLEDDFQAITSYRKSISVNPSFVDPRISLLTLLLKHKMFQLSFATSLAGLQCTNYSDRLIVPFLESYYRLPEDQRVSISNFEELLIKLEAKMESNVDQISNIKCVLAQLWLQVGSLDKAANALNALRSHVTNALVPGQALKPGFVDTWNSLHWNLSILFLKSGRLQEGWQLFDYGLRVKADGPQRWQRSLKKPFGSVSIPLWRGQDLSNKSILLLGEQGIGDTMMFATLIPKLKAKNSNIYFYPGDRLNLIYKNSLDDVQVVSNADLKAKNLTPSDFDCQAPIGSTCQYIFKDLSDYIAPEAILKCDNDLRDKLRAKYYSGKPVIGISWQGGGRPNRVKKKSCSLKDLLPILSNENFTFVSLQYGNDGPILRQFNDKYRTNIIHDDEIDPLKDMYAWLAQVGAMDSVISIANTTVHGSGGLGVPTLCLVSNDSDWRWINPDVYKGNYWYQSVETVYQDPDGKWYNAVSSAEHWLNARHC